MGKYPQVNQLVTNGGDVPVRLSMMSCFCNEALYSCCYTVHRMTENNVDGTSSLVTEPRA